MSITGSFGATGGGMACNTLIYFARIGKSNRCCRRQDVARSLSDNELSDWPLLAVRVVSGC